MKADLVKREPEILKNWESKALYQQIQESRKDCSPFVLHDGPPFANGDVHMGTALNKTLKDIIVKSKTMLGHRAPFIPGWDCHGLPIEFKVVKESRNLSPVEVRKQSESYARKYIDIQRRQFKRLGVFGDWENPYLTLDPAYEADIIRSFASFLEKNLVYRSQKPVFWSTGAQTALAEAEVEYQDKITPSIYVEFPAKSGPIAESQGSIVIWTTTPWTLPANLAITLHPELSYELRDFNHPEIQSTRRLLLAKELVSSFTETTGWQPLGDPIATFRGKELENSECSHPFLPRSSRVILGDFVTTETGTGCVHTAPGHGEDDYLVGRQYGLDILSPVDDRGCFTEECGVPELVGQYVFKANPAIISILESENKLLGQNDYAHSYPHCWRSKTPVIFRAVEQFFIKINAFRPEALEIIDQVKWLPHWGRNRIYGTVESRPDWCISRQRTWGVPLPVFYTGDGSPILDPELTRKVADLVEEHGTNLWFEKSDAEWAEMMELPADTTRRHDTLDVWIDSGVSHQAVLRKHPELHFPADLYIEATDQHRGWFQSSLMTSVAMNHTAPYKAVLTHGFVVDVDGKKISKSSSYQKPMDAEHFINKFGADLVRLWVSSINFTDEVPFSEEMFTRLSDTYRRIRNTIRILHANLHDFSPATDRVPVEKLPTIDRWVLARLNQVIQTCRAAYDSYEFHKVYHALNHFCAVDLSSLYIDITKDRMYCDRADSLRRRATQTVMFDTLHTLLPLLAPILVFTADEAWGHLQKEHSIHLEFFPETNPEWDAPEILRTIESLLDLRSHIGQAIEAFRQDKQIGNALEASVQLALPDEAQVDALNQHLEDTEEFFILSQLEVVHAPELKVNLSPNSHQKCDRCWRQRESVGTHPDHPTLCSRCTDVVNALPNV